MLARSSYDGIASPPPSNDHRPSRPHWWKVELMKNQEIYVGGSSPRQHSRNYWRASQHRLRYSIKDNLSFGFEKELSIYA